MNWFEVEGAFAEMQALSRAVDAMVGRDWRAPRIEDPIALLESETAWTLRADLPGTRKEDVAIGVEGGALTLEARREARLPEGARAIHRERRSLELRRTWRLPDTVDADAVSATFTDGVLSVTLPKRERARPRQIEIH